jgi:hypothetical protein
VNTSSQKRRATSVQGQANFDAHCKSGGSQNTYSSMLPSCYVQPVTTGKLRVEEVFKGLKGEFRVEVQM